MLCGVIQGSDVHDLTGCEQVCLGAPLYLRFVPDLPLAIDVFFYETSDCSDRGVRGMGVISVTVILAMDDDDTPTLILESL